MSNETNRRDFLGYTFAAVAAVGGAASLVGMKKAWDPLPSVLASGFTEFDLSKSKAGEPSTIMWRGKPIFILKKTAEMEDSKRDLVVNGDRFTIAIGLCTHLGCIPAWKKICGNAHVMVGSLMLVGSKHLDLLQDLLICLRLVFLGIHLL